ncbi:hypothetical protein HAX54_001602 [Datura stramonium]|uniref:NAC domain-containing protein n=1 Tax=Datura stramonium TaxID=4076 RepID=A0ABS8T4P2_DATST|nr:hypothetical protein [Datura stramonium]
MNSSSSSGGGMGFRFRPVDDELISYLIKFVSGNPFDSPHIRVLDLYGNKKPSHIFHDLSPDGESTDGLDAAKKVLSNKGSVIGFKKNFRYYDHEDGRNLGHDQRVVWTMKEYRLSHSIVKVLRRRNQIRHETLFCVALRRRPARSHVINNCDDQEIGENNISVVTEGEQAMLGLGGHVGADAQNHETVPISNSEEGYGAAINVHAGAYAHGRAIASEGLSKSSSYVYFTFMCPFTSNSNICDDINEFELREVDEQEFERAKASVPLLEESLSELSNILLQGSDDNDRSWLQPTPGPNI